MRQTYAERIEVLKTAADKPLNGLLDVVHAGVDRGRVEVDRAGERRPDVPHLRGVLEACLQVSRARAVPDRSQQVVADVGVRIA